MRAVLFLVCLVSMVTADNLLQLANSTGVTAFVKLVNDSGFAHTLESEGLFTVFAPSNDAIALLPRIVLERILSDRSYAIALLKFHMVSGHLYTTQITNEMVVPSMCMTGGKYVNIRFNIPDLGQNKLADGCKINLYNVNMNASNGVLHHIEKVMYPFPLHDIPSQLQLERSRFSNISSAIQKATLASNLSGGPYTFFAPNDAAFAKLPYSVSQMLFSNITALTEVLKYHVLEGSHWSSTFLYYYATKMETLEGRSVSVSYDFKTDRLTVNDAVLIGRDIAVTNGVIQEINEVLLPPAFETVNI